MDYGNDEKELKHNSRLWTMDLDWTLGHWTTAAATTLCSAVHRPAYFIIILLYCLTATLNHTQTQPDLKQLITKHPISATR